MERAGKVENSGIALTSPENTGAGGQIGDFRHIELLEWDCEGLLGKVHGNCFFIAPAAESWQLPSNGTWSYQWAAELYEKNWTRAEKTMQVDKTNWNLLAPFSMSHHSPLLITMSSSSNNYFLTTSKS